MKIIEEEEIKIENRELAKVFFEFLKKEGYNNLKINEFLEEETLIPVCIFKKNVGCFESVVKYLKENKKYTITKIAKLTNRGKSTISISYKKANKKHPSKFKDKSKLNIPLGVIRKEGNVLGNIVLYLYKEKLLSINKIATHLNRSYQTIWITLTKRREML